MQNPDLKNTPPPAPDAVADVSLRELFGVFTSLGLTSFGGGLSGWIYRAVVEQRQWLTTHDFLAGLSLARTMPGVNVINLSIWVGYRLRRGAGAVSAVGGVLAAPMVVIIACAMLYRRWGHSVQVHQVLVGIAAAALGLSLSMGFKGLRAAVPRPFYALIIVLLFIAVGVLRWPMVPVVTVLAPISIAWACFVDKADER